MRIGELARQSGLSRSRIRFYEAKGLLAAVDRTSNGYREYPADAAMILGIIVGAQRTGFALDEIKRMLPADLANWRRGELIGALRHKVADIERMEEQLAQSKAQLRAVIRKIERGPAGADCAENTRRLLREFAPGGSRPAKATGAASSRTRAGETKRRAN
jgi:DNA-binding transcriptional MerR regulator